eukprot:COSAG02_NODE_4998_length_4734_cov_9.353614_1_plen_42_part_00
MKQGMVKDDALTRLKDSLEPAHTGLANAIATHADELPLMDA